MIFQKIPLSWLQLTHEKPRLLVAVVGIAFADILMFMQMGFQTALYDSATKIHQNLRGELVLISPQARNLAYLDSFPRRRLYQAMSITGVNSADAVYVGLTDWKHPQTQRKTEILVLGFDPDRSVFQLSEINQNLHTIKQSDMLLFDQASRGDYQRTIAQIAQGKIVSTEVGLRKIHLVGLFKVGPSFGPDGNLITSDLNFVRIFSKRKLETVSLGLITLQPGIDPQLVLSMLQAEMPDVKVLSKQQFIDFEKAYWQKNTPIGFIFTIGTMMGFLVGVIIVYQILYADVADHIAEYATLKAIGYENLYLLGLVFQEALILAVLGYIPGVSISAGLYALTRNATNLPLFITFGRTLLVLILTVVMCTISGAISMQKLRSADPSDIF